MDSRIIILIVAIAVVPLAVYGAAMTLDPSVDDGETHYDVPTPRYTEPGEVIEISLKGNITTGYDWVLADSDGLTLVSDEYIPDYTGEIPLCGSGGSHVFRFSCDSPGSYTLRFDYLRPWEDAPIDSEIVSVLVPDDSH
ncbi:MAG: hypothetical protein E7Z64_06730 [Thermoplasmata archaeon]|nr:hypothetical protein [Thermoplasmata archaeon]